MKKLIVITLLFAGLFSCSNGSESTENAATTAESNTISNPVKNKMDAHAGHDHDDHAGHDHAAHAGHDHGGTEGSTHVKASPISPYLGVWKYHLTTYKQDYYKNRWIEFFADGTFENGIGGKKTNRGKWTLDLETNIMDFDYEDNSVEPDEQWKTQIHSPILLLLGNTPKNDSGGQINMKKLDSRPTE